MALICIEEIEKQNHVIDKHNYELIITYTFMYQTKNAKVPNYANGFDEYGWLFIVDIWIYDK